MDKILFNLALIDTTQFCIANKIDCSGSFLQKYPRRYQYTLYKYTDKKGLSYDKPLVTVTFHKSSVPTHFIH